MMRKKTFGIILIALSVILLIISGLGIFSLIPGAAAYEDMSNIPPESKYVKAKTSIIFDTFAQEYDDNGEVIGEYAIIPYGQEYFIALYLPEKYIESANQVYSDTQDYLNGKLDTLDNYFEVYGTIRSLDEDVQSEFLTKMEGLADNALMYVISTDNLGYLPTTTVIILTAVSTIFLVCGIMLIVSSVRRNRNNSAA